MNFRFTETLRRYSTVSPINFLHDHQTFVGIRNQPCQLMPDLTREAPASGGRAVPAPGSSAGRRGSSPRRLPPLLWQQRSLSLSFSSSSVTMEVWSTGRAFWRTCREFLLCWDFEKWGHATEVKGTQPRTLGSVTSGTSLMASTSSTGPGVFPALLCQATALLQCVRSSSETCP
ncbi:hypothetical protein HJG60_008705 [Phyllostomus discolor]|uniref:Uncharacterized protein n=1 Tax=Phyllostomus discolor TaxID=89673 RepID=A0A833YSA0_9CHIR|nr:hypothetical protein HJG60_008705 [Phyllostomus discolor]